MAHNVFNNRFMSNNGKPAWHELGKVYNDPTMDLNTAFCNAGMDYQVELLDLSAQVGMEYLPVKYKAITRYPVPDDPEYRVFGVVSPQYNLVTNADLVEYFSPLAKKWPVETVGALFKGEVSFFTLSAGEVEVNGDLLQLFFMVSNYMNGLGRAKVCLTPIRVVCWNTLVAGEQASKVNVSITHRSADIRDRLKYISRTLTSMQESIDRTNELFTKMGKTHLSAEEVQKVFDYLIPIPEVVIDVTSDFTELAQKQVRQYEEAVKTRTTITGLYEKFNDEFPKNGETGWALYNSFTEYNTHYIGKRTESNVWKSIFSPLSSKAFEVISTL